MTRRFLSLLLCSVAVLQASSTLAQCPQDDPASNNDCASAIPLSSGLMSGLAVQSGQADFFSFTLAPREQGTALVLYDSAAGDIGLAIYDDAGTCFNPVAVGMPAGTDVFATIVNCSSTQQTYTLGVSLTSGTCNDYDLDFLIAPYTTPGCTDGSSEENDTPTMAAPLANGGQSGPFYSLFCDEDWFIQTVPANQQLETRVDRFDSNDLAVQFYDLSGTTVLADSTLNFSGDQLVTWNNSSPSDVQILLRIAQETPNACSLYYAVGNTTLLCNIFPDDALEDNDSCTSPVLLPSGFVPDLFCRSGDEDYYRIDVPVGMRLRLFTNQTEGTDALDFDLFLSDGTCSIPVGIREENFQIDEEFTYDNPTAGLVEVVLRARSTFGGCTAYNLSTNLFPSPCAANEDSFEDNDDCASAVPLPLGTTSGLSVRRGGVDEDWYSIELAPGELVLISSFFNPFAGDIRFDLYESCGGSVLGSSNGGSPVRFQHLNTSGAAQSLRLAAYVDPVSTWECNSYPLTLEIVAPTAPGVTPLCFGDGSGTQCPCYNNSTAGHRGGCAFFREDFSFADGAVLTGSGSASVSADTLHFGLTGALANSFALLLSGDNALPTNGTCKGCGVTAFEGLRCAGGNLLRHGVRALGSNGNATNGWGPPAGPTGGLIQPSGFLAGQTRTFFTFYRIGANNFCGEAQNSSNGVSVTFQP